VYKIKYNSPVILTFALISLAVLAVDSMMNGELNRIMFSVYRTSWSDPLAYIRVLTYPLGHYNPQHYFNNACGSFIGRTLRQH
jgi:GlpG protein